MLIMFLHPSRSRLRHYSWAAALALAVIAWLLAPSSASLALRVAGAAVFVIGTFWPKVFYWVYLPLAVLFYPFVSLVSRFLPVATTRDSATRATNGPNGGPNPPDKTGLDHKAA